MRTSGFRERLVAAGGAACLGKVLGRKTIAPCSLTEADIHFGGVETFHAAHGFVERLGFEALSPLAGAGTALRPNRHWLVEDETLFTLARTKVDELAEGAEPFVLLVKTEDTHGRRFPSASCEGAEGVLAAVRCSDRLMVEFVGDVRTAHPNVVVALLTDHLGRNVVRRQRVDGGSRQHGRAPPALHRVGARCSAGNHRPPWDALRRHANADDFLGLSAWTEHYLGTSLLRFEIPWFSHGKPLSS